MARSTSDIKSSKRPGQSGQLIAVRLQPDDLAGLDAWIKAGGRHLSRPEAIRQLVRDALAQQD